MDDVTDKTDKLEKRLTNMLFTPSWLSGLIAVVAGLVVTVGVIIASGINNSQVQQQLTSLQNTTSQSTLTVPGEAPPANGGNSLQTSWPLLIFWGLTGFAVYFVVEAIISAIHNATDLRDELDYVNARPDALLRTTAQHLLFRLVVVIAWFIFMDIFLKRIIPYSIIAAHASASNPLSLIGAFYALLAFVMVVLSMHLNTIFLRLALRRPRVFSRTSYL